MKRHTDGVDRFCDQLLRIKDGNYAGRAAPITAAQAMARFTRRTRRYFLRIDGAHVAHAVHQESHVYVVRGHHEYLVSSRVRLQGHAKQAVKLDQRQHFAPQIDDADERGWRPRHLGHRFAGHHFVRGRHADGKVPAAAREYAIILLPAGRPGPQARCQAEALATHAHLSADSAFSAGIAVDGGLSVAAPSHSTRSRSNAEW